MPRPEHLEHPTEEPHAIIPPVPVLQPEHVAADARMFANRLELVRWLGQVGHGRIAEVGTWQGDFAATILELADPTELHLFEWDPSNIRAEVLADPRVILHEGDSSLMLADLPDRSLDWIYIDGDHSFGGVKRDVEVAMLKVKAAGVLVFNDYTLWSMLQMMPYGIVQNVNRLCVEASFEVIAYAFQHQGYPDVAIRRRV